MKDQELRDLMEKLDQESEKQPNRPAPKPGNLFIPQDIPEEDIEAAISAATAAFRKRLNAA